jgi:glycosyltransferase involved in cell wall biosynthesis
VLRVASIGPLHWSAGHEHAVVAAARLGAGVELRIAGEGPAREPILFAAFDLGIERSVIVGPGDQLAADVVVVPAVEDRAWPGLLQALAAGVPVVASDLPTARELGAPVLVPPRNPAALAAAIGEHRPGRPRLELTDLEACGSALLA